MSFKTIKNPLFADGIHIDLNAFCNIKPQEIVSWEQVELWCAINGADVNEDVFNFLLIGMCLYANIYEMFIAAISRTGFLDHLVNRMETMEVIYKLTDEDFIDWPLVDQWLKVFGGIHNDPDSIVFDSMRREDRIEYKFKLFTVIDRRFPLLLVQFYNKHRKTLLRHDKDFMRYLTLRMKKKAEMSPVFKKIYQLILDDQQKSLKVEMHLN